MPSVDIHYHYFPPDDVVSARHFGDLAEGLAERGWKVRVYTSNRSCRSDGASYPLTESIKGVEYHRIWRPDFPQNRSYGRILNALWIIFAWIIRVVWERNPPDVVISGTDPIFSALISVPWKWTFPNTKQVHWCFDLYPDSLISDCLLREQSSFHKVLMALMSLSLRYQDIIANLGFCMEKRIKKYAPKTKQITITPWALIEPEIPIESDPKIRKGLFGDSKIGLLYSGSFGRAHSFEQILALARNLRKEPIGFCFAVRGNRVESLKAAIQPEDHNIRFAGFASEEELEKRLSSADIHIATLQTDWTGCVVPSKIFGSLAIGRPVLFVGDAESAPFKWIKEKGLGWSILPGEKISEEAKLIFKNFDLANFAGHCQSVYKKEFSKKNNINKFAEALVELIKVKN